MNQVPFQRYNSQKEFEKTKIDDNSYSTIGPIHSGADSFLSECRNYHHSKPHKPPFGSTASRQIRQLNGNKVSDIIAYSRITYEKNEKYHDRYQQIKQKNSPFLSTSGRFQGDRANLPGPGTYNFPQIFKNRRDLKTQEGAMHCPFKKYEHKQNHNSKNNSAQRKDQVFSGSWNDKQNLESSSFSLQMKIKEKRQLMKEKMRKLKEMMKKPQQNLKPIMKRMGFAQSDSFQDSEKIKDTSAPKSQTNLKNIDKSQSLDLKEMTQKFLPKMQFNFQKQEYGSGSKIKSYKEKYQHQAVFACKDQNLYGSYIKKHEGPGPGYYEKRTKKPQRRQSSMVNKYFL